MMAVLASTIPIGAASSETVGQWGDPQRFVIHGATTFSADTIRKKLYSDFAVLLASHPLAPKHALASVLERRLRAGYHRAGFSEAAVQVTLDEQAEGVVAQVDEGPRYTTAGLRIEGGQHPARGITDAVNPTLPT